MVAFPSNAKRIALPGARWGVSPVHGQVNHTVRRYLLGLEIYLYLVAKLFLAQNPHLGVNRLIFADPCLQAGKDIDIFSQSA